MNDPTWNVDCDTGGSDNLPIYICLRGNRLSPHQRYAHLTNCQKYRYLNDTSDTPSSSEDFVSTLAATHKELTKCLAVPNVHLGVNPEYQRLRRFRRRAER